MKIITKIVLNIQKKKISMMTRIRTKRQIMKINTREILMPKETSKTKAK